MTCVKLGTCACVQKGKPLTRCSTSASAITNAGAETHSSLSVAETQIKISVLIDYLPLPGFPFTSHDSFALSRHVWQASFTCVLLVQEVMRICPMYIEKSLCGWSNCMQSLKLLLNSAEKSCLVWIVEFKCQFQCLSCMYSNVFQELVAKSSNCNTSTQSANFPSSVLNFFKWNTLKMKLVFVSQPTFI